MMSTSIDSMPEELPEASRLALASAGAGDRETWLAFFALDARLGQITLRAKEPMLAQLRLAWWRDELGKPAAGRITSDWLLESIGTCWAGHEAGLISLVNAWEQLLGEPPLARASIEGFVAERGAACGEIAHVLSQPSVAEAAVGAGAVWSLATLAALTDDAGDRAAALNLSSPHLATLRSLPHRLRPLAVVAGLGARALRRGGSPLVGDRLSPIVALRLGLFGR